METNDQSQPTNKITNNLVTKEVKTPVKTAINADKTLRRQEWEVRQKEQTKRKILWRKVPRREKPKTNLSYSLVEVKRVVNVTKGGRRFRFFAVAAVGNYAGSVGVGTGKASEVVLARDKAYAKATKNMIKVPFYNDTIAHPVSAKYCASKITLRPAPKGVGLIVGGTPRIILELLGIKNISGKSYNSNNRMNLMQATINALKKLRNPSTIFEARGLINPFGSTKTVKLGESHEKQ